MLLCLHWYDLEWTITHRYSLSLFVQLLDVHGLNGGRASTCASIHFELIRVTECVYALASDEAGARWLHIPTDQTSQATMDSVWMKNLSTSFTYSSRRKIFLQGCPPEMRRSHARRPAATLPTRFSIKQANNTIPTPINKWSFLNKVLYTEPLTEATHHTLMGPCTSQSYFSPLSLPFCIFEQSEGTK